MKISFFFSIILMTLGAGCSTKQESAQSGSNPDGPKQWLVFEGSSGPGKGKHVVLISGDEEYRSEEAMPQLAKILSTHYGFKCTVLFAQDPAKPGIINSEHQTHIPNTAALKGADLMIIATRFRGLPDDQMKPIDDFLKAGKPVLGMRTATHAFQMDVETSYKHYDFQYDGDIKEWKNGFGELVLGTTWVSHHGWHKYEATRGILVGTSEIHNGIGEGEIFGETDVYGVNWPADNDCVPLVMGQVLAGMEPDSAPIGPGPYEKVPKYGEHQGFHKNDPMMPVTWTKSYQLPGGKKGKAFCTTMGASIELQYEGTRRMIVNGALWCLGIPVPSEGAKVDIVGSFNPTMYGRHQDPYWEEKAFEISDYQ